MFKLNENDKTAIKTILDIKEYNEENFDPAILDQLENDSKILSLLKKYGAELLSDKRYLQLTKFIQHGNVTVYEHCIHVALCALKFDLRFKTGADLRALVRGALLHDYFLYDWHDGSAPGNIHPKLHGFYHPGIALKNAIKDFDLSDIEKDIIKKHMWPLTINPPRCREAWIVCVADKYASTLETLKLRKGKIAVDYAGSL